MFGCGDCAFLMREFYGTGELFTCTSDWNKIDREMGKVEKSKVFEQVCEDGNRMEFASRNVWNLLLSD